MKTLKILTAALLLTAAVPVSACDPAAPWEAFFYYADRNEDNIISLREWLAYEKGTALRTRYRKLPPPRQQPQRHLGTQRGLSQTG